MRLTPNLSFGGQCEAALCSPMANDRQRYQRQRSYGQCHNGHSTAIARLTRQTTPLR